MALSKDFTVEIEYNNPKLQYDREFKNAFPNLADKITQTETIPDAYIAITHIEGNKDLLVVIVGVYTDSEKIARLITKVYEFIPDTSTMSTPNFYVQAYEYMKTLPEYSGAIDC